MKGKSRGEFFVGFSFETRQTDYHWNYFSCCTLCFVIQTNSMEFNQTYSWMSSVSSKKEKFDREREDQL